MGEVMASRRVLVVVNRKSRRGHDDLEPALEILRAAGLSLVERDCPGPGPALSGLIRAEAPGLGLVVVAGGDGTLNGALEGLVETGLPLGVLPLGTGNDFARTLGIPPDPVEAAAIIAALRQKRVDLGWVNGKHFLNVASVGLSVKVARALSGEVKKRWGRLGYALSSLKAIREARPFHARLSCDGRHLAVEALQVSVANGRHFGGGMTVAEDARIDDARFDLVALGPCGIWELAASLPAFRAGRHRELENVLSLRGREIDLATDRPLKVNTDGEITTATPARFRIRPQALRVIAPEA